MKEQKLKNENPTEKEKIIKKNSDTYNCGGKISAITDFTSFNAC